MEAARHRLLVALALEQKNIAPGWAILAMLLVILAYDQLLFRPLVAWSAKFRFETIAGATASDPWMLRLMRRTRLLKLVGETVGDAVAFVGGLRLSFRTRQQDSSLRRHESLTPSGSACCSCSLGLPCGG